ncbi:bile acid:sodium symporter [Beutenbergia cavernae DSM 12333]|uniref:Bile acid:sodium symporter n=1 Tax=Beutenbergia cavernae (strain ATCC BAA-8 / DSM 12333 / CCUG 43141 / JCM 11478 / NBRC 16432 / NCIMB 13614 / HKI 0122) TaxID=471853 RepID=C5BV46_BEUC1|nr:bile acid:sodium symporter family protein [Beutenbergia cavernae]ACQ80433.1 bile acid:sodium symporter [Beutenbergia cavernae DSM 12333]
MKALRAWVDPFVLALVATLLIGLFVPTTAQVRSVVDVTGDIAVTVLFLVYGMRLATREVVAGLRDARLQGAMLAATFVLFPALGLLLSSVAEPLLGTVLATGMLFLTLLPSTVQSSVAFVSVARGDVAGAICGATLSNVLGMLLTPALVLLIMGRTSGAAGLGGLPTVLLHLLLPFVVGQLLSRWTGPWIRARRWLTVGVDRTTILLVVLGAVATATANGTWSLVRPSMLVWLILLSGVLLTVVLLAAWFGAPLLRLGGARRSALLMVGSTKSLATGLPMAAVLFSPALAAQVAVPVIVFHQLQLITCAVLARRIARRPDAVA